MDGGRNGLMHTPICKRDGEVGYKPSLTSERVGSTHTNAHENVVTADKGVSNATGLADSSKQQGGPNANEPMADANIVGASMDAKLRNEEHVEGAAVTIPLSAIEEVSSRFANTLYGYFVGKRLAFRLVENYVQNDSDLHKAKIKKVPVWVKLHHVPIVAYSEVGLSLITTQIGKPIRLDAYTSNMCLQSWGRSAYARALIEVSAEDAPKEELVMCYSSWRKCPKLSLRSKLECGYNVEEIILRMWLMMVLRGNSTKQSGSYVASTSREGGKSAATRIPGLKTLSSISDENGSKLSSTGERGSLMNEIEHLFSDRNLLDWTSIDIPGSKVLFLFLEEEKKYKIGSAKSVERVKSRS
ncbi:zinc knuckle CX2CX4HX4C containing protein [Tanacetum coccineum]